MFLPADAAAEALTALATDLRRKHAAIFTVEADRGKGRLPVLAPEQPEADAICAIQSFYAALPQLAKLRGIDADRPRHLQKVTRTR
jgi:glucosamine--fructose-6-phosphate aminotransferase (isomerizing)